MAEDEAAVAAAVAGRKVSPNNIWQVRRGRLVSISGPSPDGMGAMSSFLIWNCTVVRIMGVGMVMQLLLAIVNRTMVRMGMLHQEQVGQFVSNRNYRRTLAAMATMHHQNNSNNHVLDRQIQPNSFRNHVRCVTISKMIRHFTFVLGTVMMAVVLARTM